MYGKRHRDFPLFESRFSQRGDAIGRGDKGGFAPNLKGNEEASSEAKRSVRLAESCPGTDLNRPIVTQRDRFGAISGVHRGDFRWPALKHATRD